MEEQKLLENLTAEQSGQPAQEAGPQEEALAQAQATEQPQQQPELILGKFRTVDDLIQAYRELERAFHQARQQSRGEPSYEEEAGGLERVEQEQPIKMSAEDFFVNFADRPVETLTSVFEQAILPRVEELVQVTVQASLMSMEAWRELVQKYPDAPQYDRQMTELAPLIENWLAQGKSLPEVVEGIYKIAKAMSSPSTPSPTEQVRQQVRQQILGTMVESGGPAAVVHSQPSPEQQMIAQILEAAGGKPVLRTLGE